jgi:suppressor of ftsI
MTFPAHRGAALARGLTALLCLGAAALSLPGSSAARARVRASGPELSEPLALRSVNGLLEAALVLDEGAATVAGRTAQDVWTYHVGDTPHLPGPTLYVKPGDTLRLRYVNHLGQSTNLHTHGLHVSPLGNSDNVLIEIPPGAENDYVVRIPKDHPNGLYWYHPHVHGTVTQQIGSGLAGLIVVGRPDGGAPELDDVRQRLLGLQYLYIDPADDTRKDPPAQVEAGRNRFTDLANMHFMVNGQENPTLTIRPREWQVWNVGNITGEAYFDLRLRGTGGAADQPLTVVAVDGNPLRAPQRLGAGESFLLSPGSRVSLLVVGPPAGTYELVQKYHFQGFDQWPASFSNDGYALNRPLATVVSEGSPADARALPGRLTPPKDYFEPLDQAHVDHRRTVTFGVFFDAGGPHFTLNNGVFPNNPVFQPRLGTVEEWELLNLTGEEHPFHLHTNPYQLQSLFDPSGAGFSQPLPLLQDVANLPSAAVPAVGGTTPARMVVRMKPLDFLGTHVYHCHIAFHEDNGMMAMTTTIPRTPIFAAASLSSPKVMIYDGLDSDPLVEVRPFRDLSGGVRVAVGDVDQDGVMDLVSAPGPGGPSVVKVLDGRRRFRKALRTIRAFSERFSGGLSVAAGDLNADGYDDVIAAPASGGPPHVRIFDGRNGRLIGEFHAYEPSFRGGVSLASAILGEGGRYAVVTGAGPGREPEVKVFEVDWYGHQHDHHHGSRPVAGGVGDLNIVEAASHLAYEPARRVGVNVGTGPVAGISGGFSCVLAAPQSGSLPLVKLLALPGHSGHTMSPLAGGLTEMASFWAYGPGSAPGVSVSAVSTLAGADVIVGPTGGRRLPLGRFRYDPTSGTFQRVHAGRLARGSIRPDVSLGGK